MIDLPRIPSDLDHPLIYVALLFPQEGIIFSSGTSYATNGGIHSFKDLKIPNIYFNGQEGTTEEVEIQLNDLGWHVVIDDE